MLFFVPSCEVCVQVRKLLGESWGFLCPVHTPDGAPCGLLLHLSQMAQPVAVPPDRGVRMNNWQRRFEWQY